MQTPLSLLLVAGSVFTFCQFGADHTGSAGSSREDYNEECLQEGCDGEEVSELFESYESECNEETCSTEEVREIAGTRGAINQMLTDFRNRGWAVNNCSFIGPCNYAPGDNVASGDTTFDALCTQASINQHWEDFDFDKDDWDDGFGYDAPCNINQPLGRTFNALNFLDFFGTSKPDGSNNWLPWFYSFSSNAIDELDARCESGDPNGCVTARTTRGTDDYTRLFWPFFYGLDVPSRAGTIVHEARHADGQGHNGGSGCPRGASCDTTWAYNGANRYQVMYLWWVRAQGTGISPALRNLARTRGNNVLGGGFNTRPTNLAVFGPGTASPGANFSIP